MALKLSEQEIKQRMIEWRNLKKLHKKARQANDSLHEFNQQLASRLDEDEAVQAEMKAIIETQAIRIAELEEKLFGRKKQSRPDNDDTDDDSSPDASGSATKEPAKRPPESYRRPLPSETEVTGTESHTISTCHHCGDQLTDITEYVHFIEDIILPILTDTQTKTVTKQLIQRGWCIRCGKYSSGLDLRGQEVQLGPNIRSFVMYCNTILDLSFSQISTILWDLYRVKVTTGEVGALLAERACVYAPEYEAIRERLRAGPAVHTDETTYPIFGAGGGYTWLAISTVTTDRLFQVSDSRGSGHLRKLLGEVFTGVGISDGYSLYKTYFLLHQICWVHLFRTIRDLVRNTNLPAYQYPHCKQWYERFNTTYSKLRDYLQQPFDLDLRAEQYGELLTEVLELCQPHPADPKKLAQLKKHMLKHEDALFTCLVIPGVPADNNRAEQAIRKLVLKRKKSFGCRTAVGARTGSVSFLCV
jgi:transposase